MNLRNENYVQQHDLPDNLSDFVQFWKSKLEEVPEEYREKARINYDMGETLCGLPILRTSYYWFEEVIDYQEIKRQRAITNLQDAKQEHERKIKVIEQSIKNLE